MKLTLPKGKTFSMYYKILRNYMNGPYCALLLSAAYAVNGITGKSHGVSVQSEASYSSGIPPPDKDSGCSP